MIEIRDLEVRLGGRAVLRAVGARAMPGDAIALIGRNAAGKTTLVRAMAGLVAPSGGSVALDGRDVRTFTPRERARRIAFVAQRPVVSAAFTVRETVALGRFALPSDPTRIDRALSDLGLADLADRPYHALSVGQQQRAALARALAQAEPTSVLLLDEPFAALDLAEVGRSLHLVRRHAEAGGIVVAVLHDLAVAAALAKRVWILDEGTLADDARVEVALDPGRLEARYGIAFEQTASGLPCPLWTRPASGRDG